MPYNDILSRTDAQGLIPEQVSNAMLTTLQDTSAALNLATRIPVATNQTRFPVLSALPSAYWVNGDTGMKQTTDVAWANKYINIEELAVIVPIPDNVLDDAGFDVFGAVRPLMEAAIVRALDASIFFGVNAPASFPTNVVAQAVTAGNAVAQSGTLASPDNNALPTNISAVLGTLEADGYDPNGILASTIMRGRLRSVRATDGVPLQEQVNQGEAWGLPISYPMRGLWPTPAANSVLAIMGDFSRMVVGVRRDFSYKLITEGVITDNAVPPVIQYNLPQQDMVALRVTFRVGWQVANPINYDNATEATRYPFAVLRSPAA